MITAGIDAGAATTKVVLLRDQEIVGYRITGTAFDFLASAMEMFSGLLASSALRREEVGKVYATGYGRNAISFADKAVSEITAQTKGVHFLFNTIVEEIHGTESVSSVSLFNLETTARSTLQVEGVFASVGVLPQNEIAKALQLKTNDDGYVVVDSEQRTSVRGVYAAGDVTGGLRQVITACARGAVAALSSTEVLGKKYPY